MSLFSEVISAQQAQAQEPRNVAAQRMQIQEFLANRAFQQAAQQRAQQTHGMEMQQAQNAMTQQGQDRAAQQMGMKAYLSLLKNRSGVAPGIGGMGSTAGPSVGPAQGGGQPEMPTLDFDTVSRSILKQNPNISPQAFQAAMSQFAPQFEAQDKIKMAKMNAEIRAQARGPGSVEEQLFQNALKEGKSYEEAANIAQNYKRSQGIAGAQLNADGTIANREGSLPAIQGAAKAKQTGTEEGKLEGAAAERERQAGNNIAIIDEALMPDETGKSLVDKATGGGMQAIGAMGKQFAGVSDEETQANAALQVLGGRLLNNVPRMEGPQSDKDVITYKEQAGKLADITVPAADKRAALEIIKKLSMKYPQGNAAPTGASAGGLPQGWSVEEAP